MSTFSRIIIDVEGNSNFPELSSPFEHVWTVAPDKYRPTVTSMIGFAVCKVKF
jgi:hypothetical protein